MFSKSNNEAVSFPSTWKTNASTKDASTSPDDSTKNKETLEEVWNRSTETQSSYPQENATQTEEEGNAISGSADYNETSLLHFLRFMAPKVEEELVRQQKSNAFENYSHMDDDFNTGAEQLHVLKWANLFIDGIVTAVDWSSTGSFIAVGYGTDTHDNWCDHKGAIAVWNINGSNFSPNEPELVLETSSCVSDLSFYPTNLTMIAVGTRNGEILIYDLAERENIVPLTTVQLEGSNLTSLAWVPLSSSRMYNLVTSSANGTILVWTLEILKKEITVTKGFQILGEEIPKSVKLEGLVGAPINSFSFNKEDPSLFVVQIEGGVVMLCSTNSPIHSGHNYETINLNKCVTTQFGGNNARVIDVSYSPHHRNAIVTAASDQLSLYSLLQPNKAVSTIYCASPLTSIEWSPSTPLVAAGTNSGLIKIYSFTSRSRDPVLILPAQERPAYITKLAFNKKDIYKLAVGDKIGRVAVWQLPKSVVSLVPADKSALNNLVANLHEK